MPGIPNHRRAVIVGGARTPFVRAFAEYTELDSIALGLLAVEGALDRLCVPFGAVEAVVWGGVILPQGSPNVGREIVLDSAKKGGLSPTVEAVTVTRACASSMQAITDGVAKIERGEADVVIAGGSDSTSNAALTMPPSLIRKAGPVVMNSKAGVSDYLGLLGKLSLSRDLLPRQPQVAERSTGELMGQAAERMAKRNQISREDQDALAVRSHQRAAAAIASGRFDDEIVPVTPPGRPTVYRDSIVRADTSVEQMARLRPAFAKDGTLTAANSSALTDGAACVVLMSEQAARKHGQTALARVDSWAYVGVDPADQLLMGPALAMPLALDRAGLALDQVDCVDLHEAFAAQVLCILKMLESDSFAQQRLGRSQAVGTISPQRLNIHGGSIALGHPFGATGARMVLTLAHELAQTDANHALLSICAAGGLGAAVVMRSVPTAMV
ncbi:MAG: acetyl-CoA C-acyltransferase [Oligoflexia bacterium]|nr:acetyl-CoA C-acyltransferase [Oligoflexia bacterium]